jgi:hypothetical protein
VVTPPTNLTRSPPCLKEGVRRATNSRSTAKDIRQRDDAAKIGELWKRFEWVVDQISQKGPEGPVIDEDQAAEIVIAIRDSAEHYDDTHLMRMLDVYMGDQITQLATQTGIEPATTPPMPHNEVSE